MDWWYFVISKLDGLWLNTAWKLVELKALALFDYKDLGIVSDW